MTDVPMNGLDRSAAGDEHVARLLKQVSELALAPDAALREPSKSGRTRPRFAEAVELLQAGAGLTQRDLATLAGISESQLSLFLNSKAGREISHDDVCRLAWALAGSLDGVSSCANVGRRGQGRAKLDIVLTTLSLLAGYAVQARYEDAIWRQKFVKSGEETADQGGNPKGDVLRVGWFEWSPFAERGQGGRFSGIAKELTDAVVHLLGHKRYEPVPLPFPAVATALRDRVVDLMSPVIIKLPRRLSAMQFSENIADYEIGFDAVIPARRLGDVLTPEGRQRLDANGFTKKSLTHNDLRADRTVIVLPRRETAATIAELFFGSRFQTREHNEKQHGYNTISDILDNHSEVDHSDRVPIVFTNEASCKKAAAERGSEVVLLSSVFRWPEFEEFRLPITFALHPDEPQLKAAIDEAITALHEMGYLKRLFDRNRSTNPALAELLPKHRSDYEHVPS